MKAQLVWAIPVALLILWGRATKPGQEQQFWAWFQANEEALFNFENDQNRVFSQLIAQLHKVNKDLVFEFGPNNNGRREFVISAGGIRAAFPAVESLFAAAPALPRWKFIKFRPRRAPMDISYGGISVKASSVLVKMTSSSPKVDVILYFPRIPAPFSRCLPGDCVLASRSCTWGIRRGNPRGEN